MVSPPNTYRVLYIEDHADTVEMVTLMLESYGCSVVSMATMESGLKTATEQKFDLILLDLWLPDGSGSDLCKSVREFDTKTPIIFYSAVANERDQKVALESGAQAYLIKPTDSLTLCESLSRWLNQNQ